MVAVMMILEWEGVSPEDYAKVNDAMGIRGDEDAPDGLVSHTAAVADDGRLVIVDIWESEDALNSFVGDRLTGAIEATGLPQGSPRVMPLHNHLTGSGDAGVMMMIEAGGVGTDTYDGMVSDMPAHAEGTHPAHSHSVASDGDGLVIVDVWGSPEEFQRFAEEEVAPAADKHGMAMDRLQTRFLRVLNRIRGKAPAKT
jgi:heme-degrading monooxygenase HmoA